MEDLGPDYLALQPSLSVNGGLIGEVWKSDVLLAKLTEYTEVAFKSFVPR